MGQFLKYKSSLLFCIILTVCVGLSMWLSHFIPEDYFDHVITPILFVCASSIALSGAWISIRRSEGLRVRKVWGYTLLVWGIADGFYVISWLIAPEPLMNMGADQLTTLELLVGNLLGWVLLLYPTEVLRPGWMTFKRALIQLLPMFVVVALDYIVPVNLQPLIILYPFVLVAFLLNHVHAYSVWCEDNFSSLEDIDVAWIMRYLVMLVLVGVVYMFMCLTHGHTRGFTQQWLVIVLLGYSTDQILFRRDPWELQHQAEQEAGLAAGPCQAGIPEDANTAYRVALERWMAQEKPYRNPDFKLLDLRRVLPLNRSSLSQYIHAEYGCSFYYFVNGYRIEEAKRLMNMDPDMRIEDISVRCGFSSSKVFSRTFTIFTGVTPREWSRFIHVEAPQDPGLRSRRAKKRNAGT